MYQFSLQYFKQVFAATVVAAPPSDDLPTRLQTLLDEVLRCTFVNICRALFEKHKVLFAFMMSIGVLRQRGEVTAGEWAFFLKLALPLDELPPAPAEWVEPRCWAFVLNAEAEIDALKGLRASISGKDMDGWQAYFEDEAPQVAQLPGAWESKVTPFQRLLILKIFRPEKVAFGSSEYVGASIGTAFKEPPPFDVRATFNDSSCKVPVVFVLTSGADPTQYLLALGKECGYTVGDNLKMVSLGQGQGPIAERLMAEGTAKGNWVVLQSKHASSLSSSPLLLSWLLYLLALLALFRSLEVPFLHTHDLPSPPFSPALPHSPPLLPSSPLLSPPSPPLLPASPPFYPSPAGTL